MVKACSAVVACNCLPLLLCPTVCVLSFQIGLRSRIGLIRTSQDELHPTNHVDQRRVVPMALSMAKGQNKQALLRQKMEEARRINSAENGDGGLSEEEIQERNDRLRFAQLLERGATSGSTVNYAEEEDLIAATGEYMPRLNAERRDKIVISRFPFRLSTGPVVRRRSSQCRPFRRPGFREDWQRNWFEW
jgi:hypothetical protein